MHVTAGRWRWAIWAWRVKRGLWPGHCPPGGICNSVAVVLGNDPQQKKVNQILGLSRKGTGTKAEKWRHAIVVCFYCTHWSPPLREAKLGLEKVQRWWRGNHIGQGLGPAIGSQQPHATLQAWGGVAGELPDGKGPWGVGRQPAEHEPVVCPGG